MTPKILVTRRLPEKAFELLKPHCEIDYYDRETAIPRRELLKRVAGKEGLLCLLTEKVDAELLSRAPGLKAVSTVSVGFDHVDLAACSKRGIVVTHTPGVLTETTADFAWALLLSCARRVVEGDRFLRAGRYKSWGLTMLLGSDVHGKTLGIVGFGRIGRAVARRAAGFGMRVLYYDSKENAGTPCSKVSPHSPTRCAALPELLKRSDFVTLHAALEAGAEHLIGEKELSLMKPGSFLINTARGPLVDEKALVRALKSGRLGGAGLDVYEREPRLAPGLAKLPNAVLAPHIASASVETRTKMAALAAEGLLDVLVYHRRPAHIAGMTELRGHLAARCPRNSRTRHSPSSP